MIIGDNAHVVNLAKDINSIRDQENRTATSTNNNRFV